MHLSMPAQLPCNHLLWLSLEWRALRLVQPCRSVLSPALALRCSLSPVLRYVSSFLPAVRVLRMSAFVDVKQ